MTLDITFFEQEKKTRIKRPWSRVGYGVNFIVADFLTKKRIRLTAVVHWVLKKERTSSRHKQLIYLIILL